MFHVNRQNAKKFLKGYIIKSYFIFISSYAAFLLFCLSSFCCVYFLIIDTSIFTSYGIFDNVYIHTAVCAFSVIENLILLLLCHFLKLKKETYFYFRKSSKITLSQVLKSVNVYLIASIKKVFLLFLFTFPFLVSVLLAYYMINMGISIKILYLLVSCTVVLFVAGILTFCIYIQKYHMLTFVLLQYRNFNISEIFRVSAKIMNGKCKSIFKLKLSHISRRLLSLLVFPGIYYLPYCKATETDFASENIKPHTPVTVYTEKSVVFYIGKPIKEK